MGHLGAGPRFMTSLRERWVVVRLALVEGSPEWAPRGRPKPGSYFLRMRMRYKCWRHKFATNNSQQFNFVQLTCEYRCERRVVTSNLRQIRFAFAFAWYMNRALGKLNERTLWLVGFQRGHFNEVTTVTGLTDQLVFHLPHLEKKSTGPAISVYPVLGHLSTP